MGVLKVGWRNLWRNGRRTGITVAAVAFSVAMLIFLLSFSFGMLEQMLRSATEVHFGAAQVHAPGFLKDRSFYKALENPRAVLDAAARAGIGAAPRSFGYGLVSVGHKSAGAQFWGVDPAAEAAAFTLPSKMLSGRFLDGGARRGIVLGRKLAKSLHAELGTEIVAVVQAGDGSLGSELFTVSGILKTAGENIDRSAAFVDRRDFEELFVAAGRVHEIALSSRDGRSAAEVVAAVRTAAGRDEVKTWEELQPTLSQMLKMSTSSMWILGLIFFFAAGLGVMNTMLMATYERIREFGVLKALGATPWRILGDILAEVTSLAFVGSLIGAAVGVGLALWLRDYGLDLSSFSGEIDFQGVPIDPVYRGVLDADLVVQPMLIMWVTCVVAALYPAAKAARLNAVRAMAHV